MSNADTMPDRGDRSDDTRPARAAGVGGPTSVCVTVREESDVGAARRAAARLGKDEGLSESEQGSLALVVTEAAMNIAKYGRDGMILLRAAVSGRSMIEMIAVDKGEGISDMTRALTDGYSSGGSAGEGLGAIKRMALEFDIWSARGEGTAIVARFPVSKKTADLETARIGVVCTPIPGESACGDAWLVEPIPNGILIAVADGLGHGPDAAIAADTAVEIIRARRTRPLEEIFSVAHVELRSTRGAALQIAVCDKKNGVVRSMGVGNISTWVMIGSISKSIPSQPGIVGHQLPRVREVSLSWTRGSLLAMHSDGVSARWKLDKYPGLMQRDPALAAAVLYRDFARGRDDATVLMVPDETVDSLGRT